MGPNQSIFISTWAKGQTPFILNIGCFLALGATCLSCPLRWTDYFIHLYFYSWISRTYLRSKTKHYTVKVKKIYYYDPMKPSPVPGLPPVDLPPENLDSSTDPVKEGQESQGKNMSFLPSRAFNIEVENLSFRKVLLWQQNFCNSNFKVKYFLLMNIIDEMKLKNTIKNYF